jgi:hypothetical protein
MSVLIRFFDLVESNRQREEKRRQNKSRNRMMFMTFGLAGLFLGRKKS